MACYDDVMEQIETVLWSISNLSLAVNRCRRDMIRFVLLVCGQFFKVTVTTLRV